MSVSGIMPRWLAQLTTSLLSASIAIWKFLKKLATCWLMSVPTISMPGKIFLTALMLRRRHGQAGRNLSASRPGWAGVAGYGGRAAAFSA